MEHPGFFDRGNPISLRHVADAVGAELHCADDGLAEIDDLRALSDASATQGVDGWGALCSGLGNLYLAEAEDAESRLPVLNVGREMTIDTGGAGRWRGQPGTLNVKQVLAEATGVSWIVSRTSSPGSV